MDKIAQHNLLVTGDSFEHCSDQVRRFFDLTSLVIYDCIEVDPEHSFAGTEDRFSHSLQLALERNRSLAAKFLDELVASGIETSADLLRIEQGYVSKTFHILSHFMDGFIGIDSFFYNLIDDSHWLPEKTQKAITKRPDEYWLIHIDGYSATPGDAGLLHL